MSEMAQVLIRKAVRQNGTTYVALPIGFVRENDIQPGDKLWIAVGKKSVNVRKIEVPE
jgi:hypothetical protein